MAFGQVSGPPAPAKQLAQLTDLLARQGYASFKEARHPLDLTQRQAAGKFTSAEATELIERLTAAVEVRGEESDEGSLSEREQDRQEELVVNLSAQVMATELVNRGWCCIAPE
jgi:hypothetical protein